MEPGTTVMLTDIQDSTWLWEHHPEEMERVIVEHHQLIAERVGLHRGRVLKSTGDGVLALFAEAADAVDAAIDVQRHVMSRPWTGIGELHVRIGLNSGACKLTNGDIIGRAPNLAARLQAAGHGGQILLSGATAAACEHRLGAGVRLVELGRYLIRGFDEPIAVHTVVAHGLRADFPPLRADYSGFDEMPPDETELIGRDELIDEAAARLGKQRVVTLWGPAGVGKTRVAVRVAMGVRRAGRGGVRFVDLTGLVDSTGVGDALVAAVRAQPLPGELPVETVTRALGAADVLLVLDGCEHHVDVLRPIALAITQRCRGARILMTSREPLMIDGESRLEVRPLAVPIDGPSSLTALADVASVRLFVTHVASSKPGFTLTAGNAAAVSAACRATDGLPLALELAAARAGVNGLDPDERRRSPLHGDGDSTAMSDSLMRTVATLSPEQVELFSSLAVLSGSFPRSIARRLADGSPTFERDLDRLVRTAMIQTDDHSGRYRLLAPARQVGWRRLTDERRAELSWRHARLMLSEAEAIEALMRTEREAEAVATVGAQFADHRVALHWFLHHNALAEASRLVCALFTYCLFQPQSEGHRWAMAVADRIVGDEPRAAEVVGAAAIGQWFAGDTAGAVQTGNRAVAIAGDNGQPTWWARIALIDALGYAGDLTALQPHFVTLVADCRASDDPFWRTYGIGLEAISLTMFGRVEDAMQRAEDALSIARSSRNPECLHWALYALGRVLAASDPAAAIEAFEQAMRASREVGSRFNVGLSLVEWVGIKRSLGHSALAIAGTLDLLDLVAMSGNRSQLSQALREAGTLLADAGRHEQAALALLARRGLPAMPTRADASGDDSGLLAGLKHELGDRWTQIRVRASALAEPDLVALCRAELSHLT